MTSIGDRAFYTDLDNLTTIVAQIEDPFTVPDEVFSTSIYSSATLYIPQGTKTKYEATSGWKNFYHIEEGYPTGISSPSTIDATEQKRYTLDGESN